MSCSRRLFAAAGALIVLAIIYPYPTFGSTTSSAHSNPQETLSKGNDDLVAVDQVHGRFLGDDGQGFDACARPAGNFFFACGNGAGFLQPQQHGQVVGKDLVVFVAQGGAFVVATWSARTSSCPSPSDDQPAPVVSGGASRPLRTNSLRGPVAETSGYGRGPPIRCRVGAHWAEEQIHSIRALRASPHHDRGLPQL